MSVDTKAELCMNWNITPTYPLIKGHKVEVPGDNSAHKQIELLHSSATASTLKQLHSPLCLVVQTKAGQRRRKNTKGIYK